MVRRLMCRYSILILLCSGLKAQQGMNITTYKETEGMTVYQILTDRQGQVWLGTSTGLMMYNGYKFNKYYYNPNDSTSIKGTYVISLFEDRRGKIWISTGDGIYRYNPATRNFKAYAYSSGMGLGDSQKEAVIVSMASTAEGVMLFGAAAQESLEKSLIFYNDKIDFFQNYHLPDSLNPGAIGMIRPDHLGNTFLMGVDNQLFYLDAAHRFSKLSPFSEIQIMTNQTVTGDFRYDELNRLWVLRDNGTLLVFDQIGNAPVKSYSFQHLVPKQEKRMSARTMILDKNNVIWIGLDLGLISFDRTKEKFEYHILPKDNKGNKYQINSLQFDSFNNLWIGTQNGLLKYEDKPVFISYTAAGQDTALVFKGYIGQLHQSKDSNILVPTMGDDNATSVWNELNLTTQKITRISMESILPKGVNLYGYSEVGMDTFNLGTDHGIFQMDRKQRRIRKISIAGIPNTHPGIVQFYKDAGGNEWVGTINYLYRKLKGEDTYTAIDLSKQPGGNDKSNMVMVENGKSNGLWLITANGLFLYDYAIDSITRHGYDKKTGDVFLAQGIYAVHQEDSSGVLWVGTEQGGLNRYDIKNKKIKTYTVEDGLPDMNVYSILHDDSTKALWLGTQEGISRFDIRTGKFTNYSAEDGVVGKRFGNKLKTSEGQFFFGGEGLVQFNPKNFKLGSVPPLVSFTDFKVSNRSMAASLDSLTDQAIINLKYNQNNITIDYLGVHYSNPDNNKFAYILENYDEDWVEVGTQHAAFYTNLPPGKYTFKVKAANSNGVWNEKGAQLNIEIKPPWWKTNLAYAFYLLGLVGLGSIANQFFKQRVLKKERERSQLKELEQAREIEKAYKELEISHQTLKATQSQLIQSEKMASLGELTAGIAHEIQNPLNFVNNFSDVNTELIDEISQAVKQGNSEEVIPLLDSLKENEGKIRYHGQRADAIVKSMLQHSRVSNSKKEMTDINALADEYLRLAYHGLRAKDKGLSTGQAGFNATLVTHFDPEIGKIKVIPQDIGRVLLNLFNNAFYAVHEKFLNQGTAAVHEKFLNQGTAAVHEKFLNQGTAAVHEKFLNQGTASVDGKFSNQASDDNPSFRYSNSGNGSQTDALSVGYKPTVTVSTRLSGPWIEIAVEDNGTGIPDVVKEKIFQPFYTTKPTGQGTGLGLSLAYDILKAHGGTISVNSYTGPPGGSISVISNHGEPGDIKVISNYGPPKGDLKVNSIPSEGTEFIVRLPRDI